MKTNRGHRVLSKILTLLAAVFILEATYLWIDSLPKWHSSTDETVSLKAVVTEITGTDNLLYEDESVAEEIVYFNARLKSGQTVSSVQYLDAALQEDLTSKVEVGDRILLLQGLNPNEPDAYFFGGFDRISGLFFLILLFLLGILLLGRSKGFLTILSLILTVSAVFTVLIPAILSGLNIYLFSILTCAYIIGMSLLLINGYSRKTLVAILGCLSGVLVSALLTVIMNALLHLTGLVDEQSYFLLELAQIMDLRGILFGGILIGSVGAVMDVAMSVSASLHELALQVEKPTFRQLFSSGLTIGRDMMGTMANTLILAYIGSSLTTVVLLIAFNSNVINVLNSELIASEILQAVAGSLGILISIPLTALLSALFFQHLPKSDAQQQSADWVGKLQQEEKMLGTDSEIEN